VQRGTQLESRGPCCHTFGRSFHSPGPRLYCNRQAATARGVFGSETLTVLAACLPHLAAFAATWGQWGGTAVWAARHSGRGHAISYLTPVAPWALVTPVRAGLENRQSKGVGAKCRLSGSAQCDACLRFLRVLQHSGPRRGLPGKSKPLAGRPPIMHPQRAQAGQAGQAGQKQ
jgi:hypothetical protein